jgi:hypothetical protein
VYTDSRVSRVRSTYCTTKSESLETEIGLKVRADTCVRVVDNQARSRPQYNFALHTFNVTGWKTDKMYRTLFPAPIMITGKSDVQCAESKKSKALEELAPFEEQFVYACP